jgi:hypothetical protein
MDFDQLKLCSVAFFVAVGTLAPNISLHVAGGTAALLITGGGIEFGGGRLT